MSIEVKNISGDGNPTPRKVGLSCAECRRSKLKCDRVFPCQSCIRRGCANICPDGALTATKGNKFSEAVDIIIDQLTLNDRVLMAHAEKLSEQVKTLASRVQQLEAALAQAKEDATASQAATTQDVSIHEVSKAIGSLSIGSDGQAKYHGESAGSEYFQELLSLPQESELEKNGNQLELPIEVVELMNAFPFGVKDCPYSKSVFMPYLPSRERALEVVNIYFGRVAWMYDPITREELMSSIINPIFSALEYADFEDTHPAATFVARQYQALSRAAVSFDSLTQEVTCATVQVLFLMLRFAYNSDRRTNEERWLLTGLAARLAQVIGLQRDSEGWNLESEEVQRRRRLFWELFTWDSWTAIVNGRPPALMLQHTDCKFPEDLDSAIKTDGEMELSWHAWKFRYAAACLSPTVQHIFSTRAPPYAALLELDKIIRRFTMPTHLRSPYKASDPTKSWSLDVSRAMQQYCALCLRESNLLYIHRSYFAQAIRQDSENPLRHPYAPSVLATYRSACRLISALRGLYAFHPQMTSQVWFFWSGIYSACIVLGALVVESPRCTLARDAIQELDMTLPFYEEGSDSCRPPNSLTILQKLRQRAAAAYNPFVVGSEETLHRSIGIPGQPDELEVLGGRKTVITHRTQSNPPSMHSPSSSGHAEDDDGLSPASNTGAAEMLVEYFEELGNPSFAMSHAQHYAAEMGQDQQQQSIRHLPTNPSDAPPGPYQEPSPRHYPAGTSVAQRYDSAQQVASSYGPAWEQQHGFPSQNSIVGLDPATLYGSHMYQYLVRQEHQQSQDDIWRNFVSDYHAR